MKIVVSFAVRNQGSDEMVSWRSGVIIARLAEVVSYRIHTKCGMVGECKSQTARIEETPSPIVPPEACHRKWNDKGEDEQERQKVVVLPLDEFVLLDIGHVDMSWLESGCEDHPAKVSMKESFVDSIGILIRI